MVRVLARRSRVKIPMVRSKRSVPKKVRLGVYRTQIRPSDHDIEAISVSDLTVAEYQEFRQGF